MGQRGGSVRSPPGGAVGRCVGLYSTSQPTASSVTAPDGSEGTRGTAYPTQQRAHYRRVRGHARGLQQFAGLLTPPFRDRLSLSCRSSLRPTHFLAMPTLKAERRRTK